MVLLVVRLVVVVVVRLHHQLPLHHRSDARTSASCASARAAADVSGFQWKPLGAPKVPLQLAHMPQAPRQAPGVPVLSVLRAVP